MRDALWARAETAAEESRRLKVEANDIRRRAVSLRIQLWDGLSDLCETKARAEDFMASKAIRSLTSARPKKL